MQTKTLRRLLSKVKIEPSEERSARKELRKRRKTQRMNRKANR